MLRSIVLRLLCFGLVFQAQAQQALDRAPCPAEQQDINMAAGEVLA